MTDNDAAFTVKALPQAYRRPDGGNEGRFTAALRTQGVCHVRTQVHRLETSRKAERFHRTVRVEYWRSLAQKPGITLDGVAALPKEERRQQAARLTEPIAWEGPLTAYLRYCNQDPPHIPLDRGGRPPEERRFSPKRCHQPLEALHPTLVFAGRRLRLPGRRRAVCVTSAGVRTSRPTLPRMRR